MSTCAAAREESPAIRSCEEVTDSGATVLFFSSTENPIGDNLVHGLTWTVDRVDPEQSVSASVVVTDVAAEPGRESGEDLPVSRERLVGIAADPDLAMRTTQTAIEQGEDLGEDRYTE